MLEADTYLNQVKQLPPSPALLPELLRLLNESDVNSSQVVRLISYDPALTASVLQLCNSCGQSAASPVSTLEEAIVRLGFGQVYDLVATSSVGRLLRTKHDQPHADQHELWRHSVTTAVAAQLIARDLGDDANVVFTAALLHDIGKIILFDALDMKYAKLVEEVEKNQYSLIDAEKRVLGVHHADIGGRLLSRWKFPMNLSAAVLFHHYPAAAGPHQRLASLIYLGNLIAYLIGFGYGKQALALHGRSEALEILGIEGERLPEYMMSTYAESSAIQRLFKISK